MNTKRTLQTLVTSLVIFLFIPFGAHATPSVTSVSNTSSLSQGQVITILGSGFGPKSTVTPVRWDTVENQSAYSGLSNGASVPTGSGKPWGMQNELGNGSETKYNSTLAEQRGISTANYKTSNSTYGYLGNLALPSGSNKLYISWWWKPSVSTGTITGGDHSSKFTRLSNSSNPGNPNVETFSWTQQESYVYSGSYTPEVWASWNGTGNAWNFQEVWFDSANHKFTTRVNGVAVNNNVTWSGSWNFDYIWMIGWDGGGNSPPAITSYMDDIYVDNSFQRVMVGNASTYSASTKFEMQPPASWSDGQIQIMVNKGGFDTNSTAYLYVVDASGNVSAGQQITFGSGGSSGPAGPAGPAPPQNPKGVKQ
jgi:hypothetical protein